MSKSFYIASKTKHAPKWKNFRSEGVNIISTWIDEAEPGQSLDFKDLACRCISEASRAEVTVLYCEPGEILKGALVEMGAALANWREVRIVGECASLSPVLNKHPLCYPYPSLEEAFEMERYDGCPCLLAGACYEGGCSCTQPFLSCGCRRCAKYGSFEQRTNMSKHLATVIDKIDKINYAN